MDIFKNNISSSLLKKFPKLSKKEKSLMKKVNKCRSRKCSKYKKKKEIEEREYFEKDGSCPDKNYFVCSLKLYNDPKYTKSNYKKAKDKWINCLKTKCSIVRSK
jgi:hypothetical protein